MTSVSFVAKCGKVFYMEYKITLMHEQQNILLWPISGNTDFSTSKDCGNISPKLASF